MVSGETVAYGWIMVDGWTDDIFCFNRLSNPVVCDG